MKNFRSLLAISLMVALSGCVTEESNSGSKPQLAASETKAQQAAAPISGNVTLEGLPFALPDGNWNQIFTHEIPGRSPSAPQSFLVLASVNNKVIDRVAILWVQRKFSHVTKWRRFQGCLEKGDSQVLHSVVTANTGSNSPSEGTKVDCWHVRNFSLGRAGGAHPVVEALHLFAERDGLYLPATMLGVKFAQKRVVDRRSYAEYLWNPDVLLPAPQGGVWKPQDWSASSVASDPARQIVADHLTAWGEGWRSRLLSRRAGT